MKHRTRFGNLSLLKMFDYLKTFWFCISEIGTLSVKKGFILLTIFDRLRNLRFFHKKHIQLKYILFDCKQFEFI